VHGARIFLGIGGGISAYKSAELCRELVKRGATVRVGMTPAAREFITPLTLQALSGHRVATSLLDASEEAEIGHIRLADESDLCIVAPTTANLLGRIAAGLADDVVTTVLVATRAPVLLAPAMNVNMWSNPLVQANVQRLAAAGRFHFAGPGEGELACGWIGAGRMSEPIEIADAAEHLLVRDLAGRRLVVSAGPTEEDLDPVRFLGNRSTGRMGFALAAAAARRGAAVTLVAGPSALSTPPGTVRVDVRGALEMQRAIGEAAGGADAVVMAAAVSDYRPVSTAPAKIKRGDRPLVVELVPNPDILAGLGAARGGTRRPVLVGFAVETDDLEANARRKLHDKRVDLVVANAAADGFGGPDNVALLVTEDETVTLGKLPKDVLADRILDRVATLLA
jgi:phosphopantothenoylcysteine decarboxylase/phosphopantothenate--cysteine ligase